jgi:hypothetical protein
MEFALRHTWSIVLLLVALAATASVFTFARPEYHPQYESKMIDFSKQHYYAPSSVRRAFTAQGIALHTTKTFDFTVLSTTRRLHADDLQILVGPRKGEGSFGPKLEAYDERFGNVAVMYGRDDKQLLERIQAAVSRLRAS